MIIPIISFLRLSKNIWIFIGWDWARYDLTGVLTGRYMIWLGFWLGAIWFDWGVWLGAMWFDWGVCLGAMWFDWDIWLRNTVWFDRHTVYPIVFVASIHCLINPFEVLKKQIAFDFFHFYSVINKSINLQQMKSKYLVWYFLASATWSVK